MSSRNDAPIGLKEFPTDRVGPYVISKLYELDHVAYVRFASFYWNFDTVDTFIKDLQNKTVIENQNRV